jgi:hypothetical protein
MADKVISDYTLAGSIDPVADLLLIEQAAPNVYKSINRNVLLGITGSPVGNTDTQTITNKTIGSTNTVTQLDSGFTLQDNSDPTKQAQFQLSSITPGQTRIYTLPDATSTLANLTSTQTFTNKTLTGPTINGGTIDNSTINVDAISGKTASTSGSIYGVSVSSARISGTSLNDSSIATAKIADNAITAPKLATNAITLGYAQITSNSTTSSGSFVVGTNTLGVSVTIPAGGRRTRVTVYSVLLGSSGASAAVGSIYSGATVGTLTTQRQQWNGGNSTTNQGMNVQWVSDTPLPAGAIAFTFAMLVGGGNTATLTAASNFPAFILVEAI